MVTSQELHKFVIRSKYLFIIGHQSTNAPFKLPTKIHKPNIPVKPLVNFTSASGYHTLKAFDNIIRKPFVFINNYTLNNSIDLVNKIKPIKLDKLYK